VEQRFSLATMVSAYEKVYRRVLENSSFTRNKA